MKYSISGLVLLLVVLLSTGIVSATSPKPPFMTVDEYKMVHPEQDALMKAFSDVVRAPGIPSKENSGKTLKIAFIYPGLQVSDYWRRSISSFEQRMTEIGLHFTITEYFSKPGADLQLQAMQIREALKSDPDYLVFTLDIFRHKELIKELLTRDRPKLILQNVTTPIRAWEGRQPFMYVGFDHTIGAHILGDYYIKKTGGTGEYGMLYFTHGYVSTMRGDMFRNYISARSDLRQADSVFTDGKAENAAQATIEILKRFDVKFLYACSTDIALGAILALKQQGLTGKVLINGWGGGSAELQSILAGDMDATIMRMNDDNGVAMAEALRLDSEGKGDMVPQIYSGDMVLVEKGISRSDLEKLTKRAFRYSGQ